MKDRHPCFDACMIFLVVLVMLFGLYGMTVGCRETNQAGRAATNNLVPIYDGASVAEGVWDNGLNTAYISGENLLEITTRKRQWEKDFPSKKTVSMAPVHFEDLHTVGAQGLLIFYEQQ